MGCFSYLCKHCGKGVLSSSFDGEEVTLYLLNEGEVVEQMSGQYDSYGKVFTEGNKDSIQWTYKFDLSVLDHIEEDMFKKQLEKEKSLSGLYSWLHFMKRSLENSKEAYPEDYKNQSVWSGIVNAHFSWSKHTGIAAVHKRCQEKYGKIPNTKSDDDPDQGWGENLELLGATTIEEEL